MLVNVDGLPGIVDPGIAASDSGDVAAVDHLVRQLTLLRLVLVLSRMLANATTTQYTANMSLNVRGEQRC